MLLLFQLLLNHGQTGICAFVSVAACCYDWLRLRYATMPVTGHRRDAHAWRHEHHQEHAKRQGGLSLTADRAYACCTRTGNVAMHVRRLTVSIDCMRMMMMMLVIVEIGNVVR